MDSTTVILRGPQVCSVAGITYRQLDHWARQQLIRPSIADANGSGSQRLYSRRDAEVAWALGQVSRGYGPHGATQAATDALRALPEFTGIAVIHRDGITVVRSVDEVAWDLELSACVTVLNLDRCPVAERIPELADGRARQ